MELSAKVSCWVAGGVSPPRRSPHHPQVTHKHSVRHIYRKLCAMAVFPTVSFLDHKA